jgi:Uma2 family endonuclease
MVTDARVHRISNAEYTRMVDSGALDQTRVELVDGLLVDVSPQGERHARVVQRLMAICAARIDLLRVQMPLAVAEGWVPEPDIALVEPARDPDRHPSSALLVVEVAVTSQADDRRKASAYARAGVPRYWLVDVPAGVVVAYSDPQMAQYSTVAQLTGADLLDASVPGVEATTVDALLRI